MKNCEEIQELMSAYLDGELEPGEKAAIEKHLEECEECESLAAELYEIVIKLRSVPELKTPENFHGEAMQKLRDRLNPVEIFTPKAKTEKKKAPAQVKTRKIPWRRVSYASGLLAASMFAVSILGSGLAGRGLNKSTTAENGLPVSYSSQDSVAGEPFPVGNPILESMDLSIPAGQQTPESFTGAMNDAAVSSGDVFIKRYNVVINVEDFDTAIDLIDSLPGANVNMSVDYGSYQVASIARNISPSNYQYGKDFLRGFGAIQSESESEQRISSDITNLEAQLRAKEEEISRLLVILERSGTLNHLNAVESRIASVTSERDNIKTQILRFNSQASNCVLYITVNYTEQITEKTTGTYFERLKDYFLESIEFCVNAFENILVFISMALIPVIVAVIILAIVLSVLKGRSGRNEK